MHDFSQKFVFGALNPKDLLEELEKKIPEFGLYFLDICLENDMELLPEKILKCMKSAEKVYRQILNKSAKSFSIKQGGERIFLNPDEILYMEI